MSDEVQELTEAVASLTRKMEGLSGLEGRVAELTNGMSLMKEILTRMEEGSKKKKKKAAEAEAPETGEDNTDAESENHEGAGKVVTKYRKLELPLFDGEDPLGWFFRIDRYFHVNEVLDSEKLALAVVCLEGKALNWFQWKEMRAPLRHWGEFKQEALKRFHSSQRGGEYRILFGAKQEGTVLEYIEEFERLSAPLKDASEECLIGAFLNGLKAEVQAELKLAQVHTIEDLMGAASSVDEKNHMLETKKVSRFHRAQRSLLGPKAISAQPYVRRAPSTYEPSKTHKPNSYVPNQARPDAKSTDTKTGSTATGVSTTQKTGQSRRLSDAEITRRRELGLCFKCGERYGPARV